MRHHDLKHDSVRSLLALLNKIAASPESYPDPTLRDRLQRQSLLASYDNDELGIHHTSLNSLKTHSNLYISGGFAELDRARVAALQAINYLNAAHPQKTSTTQVLKDKLRQIQNSNILLLQDLSLSCSLLDRALGLALTLEKMQPSELSTALYTKESAEIYKLLMLRKTSHEA